MKKLSIISAIILLFVLGFCLVGCAKGDPIEFKDEEITFSIDTVSDAKPASADMIKSKDELDALMQEERLSPEAFENHTDEWFEERTLIVVRHSVYSNETYDFKKITVNNNKLTVKLSRTYSESFFAEIYLTFLSVAKKDVENVTSCSVTTSSMSFSFNG